MPITPQVTWEERIQHSLRRERESDSYERISDDDADNPYWSKDDVERLHAEIAQRILALMPPQELGMLGSDCVVRATFAQGAALPQDCLMIVAATIQRNSGDTTFYPATGPLSVAEWYQAGPIDSSHSTRFAIVGGLLVFKGSALSLVYLREPTLDEFRDDASILPPAGYLELTCDWVHQMLTAADWLPVGRA